MDFQHGSLKLFLLLCVQGVSLHAAQDEGKTLTGTVGEDVTLPAAVQTSGILMFEDKDLAVVLNGKSDTSFNENFRDRVQWENSSGMFTIRKLRTEDSGMFTVKNSKDQATFIFHLTVYNPVPRPRVRVAAVSCIVECSVENGREVTLSWTRGEERLNQTSSADLSSMLVLPLWVGGDSGSEYSCVAHNPVSNQTAALHLPGDCRRGEIAGEKRPRVGVIVAVIVSVAGVGALLFYYLRKRREGNTQGSASPDSGQQEVQYADVTAFNFNRDQQGDLSELVAGREERPTTVTVYDKLQLRHLGPSSSAPPPLVEQSQA